MKIGIFDSGLGGLIIAKSIFKKLPQYDYVFLGDTKNLPYGSKSPKQIFDLTQKAVDFLFSQGCQLVVVACNTSSALALRKIQQQYLPKKYPGRRVLGVVIPTLEAADELILSIRKRGLYKNNKADEIIGVIGTEATINSHIYKKELQKIDKKAKIYELATPKLVPLIEKNALPQAKNALKLYFEALKQKGVDVLILGCTHYPILKKGIGKLVGRRLWVFSQDDIIPMKLADYLTRHPEVNKTLSQNGKKEFLVTKDGKNFEAVAKRLFGKKIDFKLVKY